MKKTSEEQETKKEWGDIELRAIYLKNAYKGLSRFFDNSTIGDFDSISELKKQEIKEFTSLIALLEEELDRYFDFISYCKYKEIKKAC